MTIADGHNQQLGLERLIFFSDAVFAIAITLLVLDIKLPHEAPSVAQALADTAPRIFAFLLSFMVIGIYWLNHHKLFGVVTYASRALVRLNLLLLLTVSFLPFPTSVIAEHARESVAVILYALSVAALGLMHTVVTWVATRPPCVAPDVTDLQRQTLRWRSLSAPLVFLVSTLIAPTHPAAAVWSWLAVPAALALMTWLPRLLYSPATTAQGTDR